MRLPTPRLSREVQSLLPDGLEHPKFKSRRSYIGNYVICWKDAIQLVADRGMSSFGILGDIDLIPVSPSSWDRVL
jgi:hypothetical protein